MIRIRPESPTDRGRSLEIEREAFGRPDEAAIADVVRDLDGSFALVAEDDGGIVVGHVQMSRAWIGVDPVLSLGPIGVVPARQGQGIGSALVWAALDASRERGEIAVILLGSQAFYPRFGFRAGSTFGLRNPYAGLQEAGFVVQEDDFMIAVLDDGERTFSGDVRWHPAFGEPVEGYADPR
jgi:putative acetyltransferase